MMVRLRACGMAGKACLKVDTKKCPDASVSYRPCDMSLCTVAVTPSPMLPRRGPTPKRTAFIERSSSPTPEVASLPKGAREDYDIQCRWQKRVTVHPGLLGNGMFLLVAVEKYDVVIDFKEVRISRAEANRRELVYARTRSICCR